MEMNPLSANHAPKAATMTKDTLFSMLWSGPMEPAMISAMIPAFVSSSEVFEKSLITASCRLYAVTVFVFVIFSSTVPFSCPKSVCRIT